MFEVTTCFGENTAPMPNFGFQHCAVLHSVRYYINDVIQTRTEVCDGEKNAYELASIGDENE